jgi:hypothetical protein
MNKAVRNPGLPIKREPKVGDYHDIQTPALREWLKRKEAA